MVAEDLRPLMVGLRESDRVRVVKALGLPDTCAHDYAVDHHDQFADVATADRWDAVLLSEDQWRDGSGPIRFLMAEHGLELPLIALLPSLDREAMERCLEGDLLDCITWDELPRLAVVLNRHVRQAHERAQRRKTEEQLRLSERRFRKLVHNMHEGVLMVDDAAVITFANSRIASMLEYRAEEMLGRSVMEFIAPSRREAARSAFDTVLSNKPVSRETLLYTASEDTIEVVARTVPMFDEAGEFDYGFATIQDISERRHLQRQIRQAQKMDAIGKLAGGIAHDFNNMLTVIGGNAHLLKMEELSERGRELLTEVMQAAESAGELTSQLLTFSRKQKMDIEVLDLNQVVTEMRPMLRRMIREDIKLRVDLAEDLAWTRIDRVQIGQVLMNLAINARDAMPDGGVLTIETENAAIGQQYANTHADVEPGNYVRLTVSDTGIGMDADTREQVFEPFFTTKGDSGGTGLGLATAYGICKQMGGWIYVYSEPGEGTVFKIYLPVAQGDEMPVEAGEAAMDLSGDESVLVVEDDDKVREYATAALEQYGYTVVQAANGAEALKVLADGARVDVIVTDVVMPDIGGVELAERIEQARPGIPVLYTSGYNGSTLSHTGVEIAHERLIQKPFGPADLARAVRKILDED
jgi:PAS domain S-box-containing protein